MVDPESKTVLFEKDKERKIATITLNRPNKLNATTMADIARINSLVQEVNADDNVKVLIFKGAGEAFCSGQDLKEMAEWHNKPDCHNLAFLDGHVAFLNIRKGYYVTDEYCVLPFEDLCSLAHEVQGPAE